MEFLPNEHFFRVATACPEVQVADVNSNVKNMSLLYREAVDNNASLVVFPELSITGYTIGDIVHNRQLLDKAIWGLKYLRDETIDEKTVAVVGLPISVENGLFNCAAVLADGKISGIVPKQNMPNYSEFYESRWYQAWKESNINIELDDEIVPFGNDLLFDIAGTKMGIEICEDLWVKESPSIEQAAKGALIIANPSASNELVGKANYRRQLISMQSAKLVVGYVYSSADQSESTTDIVMSGHQMITENGRLVAERKPLSIDNNRLKIADLDLDHLKHDRIKDNNYATKLGGQVIKCLAKSAEFNPNPLLVKDPFLPENEPEELKNERFESILNIQVHGLVKRLKTTNSHKIVLGLSGGLDSTLALLVAVRSADILGKNRNDVVSTITMPGLSSSNRTQQNAQKLARALGVKNEVIEINDITEMEFKALGHDGETQDITYENVQARARTELLFNYANKEGGIVLGTGDLSEIALGWCTYNGDQMNHYNVNASIPKTLVRHLVRFESEKSDNIKAKDILLDILDTPVSPELTGNPENGITQTTEDLIGPYELHDFFLSHLIRWGDSPNKIKYLANIAFKEDYSSIEIDKWLKLFLNRFTANQFKRSAMPDGPKVGSVALSPRGDWRMPSDMNSALWE